MYVYQRQAAVFRGIATLVTLALVLWSVGTHMFTQRAEAANLTSVSDTLSDSEPGGGSVHTIGFTMPNGMLASAIFTVDFPSGFDLSSLGVSDVTMTVGGSPVTVAASNGPAAWGVAFGSNSIDFTAPSGGNVASGTALVLTIGSTTNNMITNPSATSSYEISIGTGATTTIQDSGQTRVAIIENVLVTANINTTLTFTVNGTSSGVTINGSATSTFATSSNVALPFGTLQPNVRKLLGQDLTVATNAIHGYVVTVEESQLFQSETGAVIDNFVDGDSTTTPISWVAPSNVITDDTTWGHWGLTSTDGTTTRTNEFSSDTWVSASTSPIVIMGHTGPADGTTDGIGRASVGYQVEITALQEAGDDYNTTLTYIATPTF